MISHDFKTVFVHIPKNAGQSVEHFFLHRHGLNWDNRAGLLLMSNPNKDLGPPRLAHLTAEEYVSHGYLSDELLNSYFKFAFARNPWSRVVSFYRYLGYSDKVSFKKFVLDVFVNDVFVNDYWFVRPQVEYIYSDNGELLVDFLGRFENLNSDFKFVCQKLGFGDGELKHINDSKGVKVGASFRAILSHYKYDRALLSGRRKVYSSWRDYYDDETAQVVSNLYSKDVEMLGYTY